MIDPLTIQYLWRYMVHADDQMIAAAGTVPQAGYFREFDISAGSIHKLLVHALGAQQIWLERLLGHDPRKFLDPNDLPQLSDVAARWPDLHNQLLEFAERQTPSSLAVILHGRNMKGTPFALPVGAVMLHVCDHATYHRGQLNSMIKMAGGTPSPVMLYTFAMRAEAV